MTTIYFVRHAEPLHSWEDDRTRPLTEEGKNDANQIVSFFINKKIDCFISNDPSQSLQMIERPLMTPDELKSMPKGRFIVTKTGAYPMHTRLKLFLDWGITFGKPYEIAEQSARQVQYADRRKVEEEIIRRNAACEDVPEEAVGEAAPSGGMLHTPAPAIKLDPFEQKQESVRR